MGKVYIITGANRGLGEAFVNLILEGMDTFVVSVSRKINNKQIEYLNAGRLLFIEQDLSQEIDYIALGKLTEVISQTSEIVFINNAGIINPLNEVSKLNDDEIANAINVNIFSPVLIIKYLLQHFKKNKIGFINITSGAATKSIANWSVYSSSKAFINRFFDVLKEENKDNENFSFKSIDPGIIDTEMQEKIRSSEFPLRHVFQKAKQNGTLFTPMEAAIRIFKEI
jgi:benzil reductase ((S)-benzoin forming)